MTLNFTPATGALAALDLLRIEVADAVAHIRLNRPAKRNAVNDTLVAQIHSAFVSLPEAVKAVVELNAGQQVGADELIALCKEKLGSVKAPKSIDFVATLPRSPVGKVLKKDLRAQYWQNTARKI